MIISYFVAPAFCFGNPTQRPIPPPVRASLRRWVAAIFQECSEALVGSTGDGCRRLQAVEAEGVDPAGAASAGAASAGVDPAGAEGRASCQGGGRQHNDGSRGHCCLSAGGKMWPERQRKKFGRRGRRSPLPIDPGQSERARQKAGGAATSE